LPYSGTQSFALPAALCRALLEESFLVLADLQQSEYLKQVIGGHQTEMLFAFDQLESSR
jgi:hypothetical protein